MTAHGFRVTRSHTLAFVLGISASIALAMCSSAGADVDPETLADIEARLTALEEGQADLTGTDTLHDQRLTGLELEVVPVGTVLPFGGATPPEGFLLCDGGEVSRTDYAALFAAIGTAWGMGDGSSTFNLPDLRGRFLRGADAGAGRDPNSVARTADAGGNTGDAVGSVQTDDFKSHTHGGTGLNTSNGSGYTTIQASTPDQYFLNSVGGSETRPKNAYVNYIIRH